MLRKVITNLAEGNEKERAHIPYRDSKLTSLLKQSIGGNSYCLMVGICVLIIKIACLSPSDKYLEENISTLSYANTASRIHNEPHKNIDPKILLIRDLKS